MSQNTVAKIVRFFGFLDGALQKYPSMVSILIVLGAIWATQLWSPIANEVKHSSERPGINEQRKETRIEVRNIIEKRRTSGLTTEQIQKAAQEYREYPAEKSAEKSRKAFLAHVHSLGFTGTLLAILKWMILCYLRGVLIALTFFCLQMAKRRGILATILADKKRFLLAILAWPIMIFRYPHNVVREIIVEAELRRMRSAFRKLSKSERELVREIASGDRRQFRKWRADFRLVHGNSFKRSFATALLLTIVMMVIAPIARSSVGAIHESPVRISWEAYANSPPTSVHLDQPDQTDQQDFSVDANIILASEFLLVIPLVLRFILESLREKLIRGPVRLIFHIPEFSPVIDF